jgi:hypothetical protein
MKRLALIVALVLINANNAYSCLESEESKNARFQAVDSNNDEKISYEEYLEYSKKQNEEAKKKQPGSFEKFIGKSFFDRTYHEDFSFNQTAFDNNWKQIEKDKNDLVSKENFLQATQTKRFGCGE